MKTKLLLQQLRGNWRSVILVHLFFSLLGIALLTPVFGATLQALVSLSGSAAVADQDIARLVLSPMGMLGAIFIVGLAAAIVALELGALQAISLASLHQQRISPLQATLYAIRHALPLLILTLGLTVRVLLYALPFLALAALLAWTMLSAHDINYYLSQRPAEFYYALAGGALLLALLAWLLGRKLLDWCLALPLTLVGNVLPGRSFAESTRLTASRRGDVLRALAIRPCGLDKVADFLAG